MNTKSNNIVNCMERFCLAIFLLALLVGLSSITTAQTSEPSREPMLRIETGAHTLNIWGMAVDPQERFLVTASDDKTSRVWELATGRLLRTLRPPIGSGFEGKLLGIAISPDGNMISVAGFTGAQLDKRVYVYLFERATGRMLRRLIGPEVRGNNEGFHSMSFSSDGAMLAAALVNSGQVYIFRVADGEVVGHDANYTNESSLELDYSPTGDLIVTSHSNDAGFVRLYDHDFRLKKKEQVARNLQFGHISPDGKKIAMVDFQTARVEVLSGIDLSLLYSTAPPELGTVNKATGWSVCWSRDGKTLYVGTGDGSIYRLNDEGRGRKEVLARVGDHIVQRLIPLANGELAYATEMEWGILHSSGIIKFHLSRQTRGVSAHEDGEVNATGEVIRFSYDKKGTSFATFSINERQLTYNPSSKVGSKIEALRGLYLRGGSWLSLWKGDKSSGQGNNLNNTKLWEVELPGSISFMSFSGNGRVIIASFDDGTIHWYRVSDGKELLAFFPHADRKRWVLWTPSGYYDASPGAEELIGWHLNNGRDQAADFFPFGRFRSTYYRPDVISKVLEAEDEEHALQLANEERGRKALTSTVAQMLPPIVEIASPIDNSEVSSSEITIRYSLRTPSGEAVTNIRALVDGRPITGNRQLVRENVSASGVRELKVPVPERDSEVSIIAENRFAASVPATIRLKWRGIIPKTDTFGIQPKLYVLAIGVSQYQNPSYSLKFADKDAKDFAGAVTIQKGLLYRDVVVKVLTNEHATKDEILDGLDWIRKETTSKDVAMVFFAGHGLNDQNGVYYFLPYNTDLEKLLRTGVPFTDIKNIVQSLAGKTLFFIDTCHSGNVLGGRRGLADDLNGVINELASAESGAVVFAASTGNQYSLEDAKWNNGAFTKALVEGFMGLADYSGKGRITINMLDLYISERVKELTGGKQTPTTAKPNTVPDFPIAVKR